MTLCTEYQVCDHAQAIVTDAYVTNTYDSGPHSGSTQLYKTLCPLFLPRRHAQTSAGTFRQYGEGHLSREEREDVGETNRKLTLCSQVYLPGQNHRWWHSLLSTAESDLR